jgi:hypothetical protein
MRAAKSPAMTNHRRLGLLVLVSLVSLAGCAAEEDWSDDELASTEEALYAGGGEGGLACSEVNSEAGTTYDLAGGWIVGFNGYGSHSLNSVSGGVVMCGLHAICYGMEGDCYWSNQCFFLSCTGGLS